MQVFLLRHALAVDETRALADAARHLSADGRTQARTLGERLRWYDCEPAAVWTSPLTRAVQTAEIVIAGLGWQGVIESVPALAPDGSIRELEARLRALDPSGAVLLVGHEPGLSGLGGLLTARADFPVLRKGEAARLDGNRVRWLFVGTDEAPRPVP